MANNRLQIYCKKCLEMAPLSKYNPIDWSGLNEERYNEFVEEHTKKCYSGDDFDKNFGCNMFGFRTEMDGDEFKSDYSQRPFKLLSN